MGNTLGSFPSTPSPLLLPTRPPHALTTTNSPGRFFAANELKLLMAYIILNYEFKTEVDGQRPQNKYFAHSRVPDTSAKIMYRERKGRKESVANSLIVVEQDRR